MKNLMFVAILIAVFPIFSFAQPDKQAQAEPVAYLAFCEDCNQLKMSGVLILDEAGNKIGETFEKEFKLDPSFVSIAESGSAFTLLVDVKQFPYTLAVAGVGGKNILFNIFVVQGSPFFIPMLDDENENINLSFNDTTFIINGIVVKEIACFKNLEHMKAIVAQQQKEKN